MIRSSILQVLPMSHRDFRMSPTEIAAELGKLGRYIPAAGGIRRALKTLAKEKTPLVNLYAQTPEGGWVPFPLHKRTTRTMYAVWAKHDNDTYAPPTAQLPQSPVVESETSIETKEHIVSIYQERIAIARMAFMEATRAIDVAKKEFRRIAEELYPHLRDEDWEYDEKMKKFVTL